MAAIIALAVACGLLSVALGHPSDGSNWISPIPKVESAASGSSPRRQLDLRPAAVSVDYPAVTSVTWWNQPKSGGAQFTTYAPSPLQGCVNIPGYLIPKNGKGHLLVEWWKPNASMVATWKLVTCAQVHFWPTWNCAQGNTQYVRIPTDRDSRGLAPRPTDYPTYPLANVKLLSISCIYKEDLSKLYTCPANSYLDASWAGARCYCNDGFAEKSGKCVDVCTVADCGSNADCKVENGAGVCYCHEGYRMVDDTCQAIGNADYLEPQNAARSALGLPDLVWDDSLATAALEHVTYLATADTSCQCLNRSKTVTYGQNIGGTFGHGQNTARDVVNMWVAEKSVYTYQVLPGGCPKGTVCTHYVQIVARAAERVGCASYACTQNGYTIWACFYDPKGLVNGQYPY